VSCAQSLPALRQAIRRHRPQRVLCRGLAGSRSAISLERAAINLGDARIADNAGTVPAGTPVVVGGPSACSTRLPVKALVQQRLLQAGVPAELALSAGKRHDMGLAHTTSWYSRARRVCSRTATLRCLWRVTHTTAPSREGR
jgi:pyrrolidone-carboxylate peptidase